MTSICPHCGYDLRHDEVVELDGFRIDPRGTVEFEGAKLVIGPSRRRLLFALAKAWPRPISRIALADRGDIAVDSLDVVVHHIRTWLRAKSLPQPIKAVWGYGFIWSLEAA